MRTRSWRTAWEPCGSHSASRPPWISRVDERLVDQVALGHLGVFLGLATGPEDPGAGEILRPLKAAMEESGWIEGRNVRFDIRFGGGDVGKINSAADELVALAPG